MQVGMTKNQGVYNKPSAAVHPGSLAAGTLPHNITLLYIIMFRFVDYRGITGSVEQVLMVKNTLKKVSG